MLRRISLLVYGFCVMLVLSWCVHALVRVFFQWIWLRICIGYASCMLRFWWVLYVCMLMINALMKRRVFIKVSQLNHSRSDPGRRGKINLNFYFHTSFWYRKRFYEGFEGLLTGSLAGLFSCIFLFYTFFFCFSVFLSVFRVTACLLTFFLKPTFLDISWIFSDLTCVWTMSRWLF